MGLVCFDLEGTLVDPTRAMQYCLELTCHEFGLEPPPPEFLHRSTGLGAQALFQEEEAFRNPARLAAALESYWIHFAEAGVAKHRVYEGINLFLARLKRQGHRLYAVTVQPTPLARRILHQFDLLLAFDEVMGSPAGGPALTLDQVLDQLQQGGALAGGGYLVADRPEDMPAARTHGLVPLGAAYGRGEAKPLRQAGAVQVFRSMQAMDTWFRAKLPDPEVHDAFTRSE